MCSLALHIARSINLCKRFFEAMASGPPPMLSDTQRSMKRTMARDGMVRKYDEIILRYANVQPFIPRVDDIVPKNIWERQMQRARELLRSIQVCDEEGRQQDLHRIVRRLCPFEVDEHARFRPMSPDPADDCADSEWINANLLFLRLVWT